MKKFTYKGVEMELIGHASVKIKAGKEVIYIDPYAVKQGAEKATIILYTHGHFDHCVEAAPITAKDTIKIGRGCKHAQANIEIGETVEIRDVKITAVDAYNPAKPFHPKGEGAGFIISIGGIRIYHAGDTDFIPEMARYKAEVAFLPIGGTYTMDEKEAAEATKVIQPEVVIPMHYNYLAQTKAEPSYFEKLVQQLAPSVKVVALE
ncbi:MAG: MBL fold metallo-hydrolase [Candidatus Anstonellales archaeon]